MSPQAAAQAVGGQLLRPGPERFVGVSTDSRSLTQGQAFVAIVGEKFDGHQFLRQAAEGGAALLVVSQRPTAELTLALPPQVGVLLVEDTRRALGALGKAWRRQLAPTVVAITGSVGKTTTKELTRAVLSRIGPTHATRGNLNNDIGLPLTLLAMPEGTRFLVAEMGMNAPGEIATLTQLAEPQIGCVTAIAPVHLEGLGTLERVAAAKGELLHNLPAGAFAVVPGDEPLLEPHLRHLPPERVLRFGSEAQDDVRLTGLEGLGARGSRIELSLPGGELLVADLPLPGRHNARNAAAAAGIGSLLGATGAEIASALSCPPELGHRSQLLEIGPWRLLDDCYNANPVAMRAALETLRQLAGEQPMVAVLGSKLELGTESERYHQELGAHAAGYPLRLLLTVGSQAAAIAKGARAAGLPAGRIVQVSDPGQAAAALAEAAPAGAWILIKASRGARLEEILPRLAERMAPRKG